MVKKMRKTVMNEEIYLISQKNECREIIDFQICGITHPDKNYFISRPKSKIACIEYVVSGGGSVNINGKNFSPKAGDSYFLHTGYDQFYRSDFETPWKKIFINFAGGLAESLIEGYALTNHFYFPGLNLESEIARAIEIVKNYEKDGYTLLIDILNGMFLKMYRYIHDNSVRTGTAYEMKRFLDGCIENDFKMKELCEYVSKSESQAIKLFKKEYGTTPYKYLTEKRIKLAKNLILNTNMTIKEIAAKLNFADEYYFSNVFKKKVGVSPVMYRKLSFY